MKIAIVDMIYPFGHKALNSSLIKILKSFSDIILLDYQDYYENIHVDEKLNKIQIKKLLFVSRITILKTICNCINLMIIKRKLFRQEYDALLITTYENVSLSTMRFLFKNKPLYIIQNNNIDLLQSKTDTFFFRRYMNSVNHIVFAQFIKEGLTLKMNVNPDRVFVLEHPLIKGFAIDVKNDYINKSANKKVFVSLGLSSDENLIRQLIKIEKESEYFKNNGMKLILRSSIYKYESDGLRVFTGTLPEDEYYRLYKTSSAYLLLYPKTFQNRFSGSFLDALQCGKCIISTDIPIAHYFKNLYPINCRIITDAKDLLVVLANYDFNFSHKEYNNFLKRHDDSVIRVQAMSIFSEKY